MNLEVENFKKLFSIIKNYPMSHIIHIDEGNRELVEALFDFVKDNELVYHLNIIDNSLLKELEDEFKKNQYCKIRPFSFEQGRYTKHSVLYDTAFVTVDISKVKNLEDVLKKIYRVMKNSGDVILFAGENVEEISALLENLNYVAINSIDGFEPFIVITAKKMHGWKKV